MTRRLLRGACAAGLVGASIAAASGAGGTALAQATPASARNVVLCHGDGPPCETNDQSNGGGDEHLVTAFVTDAAGAPVAGVPVEIKEQGEGRFTTGGDSVVVTTGSDGRATAVVTSDEVGTSSITAEISPPGTAGGFRGPATHDDECEQPSAPSGVPAGNCISRPLTVHWHVPPPSGPACSDGLDNDADGAIDYPDDASCVDEHDDSEVTSDPPDARSMRKVSIAFAHGRRDRMVVFGRVEVEDDGPAECSAGVALRILRRSGGRWVARATVTTSRDGWYVAVLRDRPGRYRVSAPRYEAGLVDGTYWICKKANRAKDHRHEG